MTRTQTVQFARDELVKHGLSEWKIRLDTNSNSGYLGLCVYRDKCIILNAHHIDIHPEKDVINTIRHEIAHALTPGSAHNEIWEAKAREVGCDNTMACSNLSLPPAVIDAIRSGANVEVEFDEQVIRTPKYKITRLQDRCPECGLVAKERFSFETIDTNTGDTIRLITLECWHIIKKIMPKGTPFETLVSNHWKPEIKECKHEWDKNKCVKCGEFKLYEFQLEGARFIESAIATAKGGAIFDEMGLGKTVQALGYLKFHPERWPVLFIVKSGLKFQFFKEILRWLGPDFVSQIINTSKDYVFPGLKGYIIGYDMLRRFPREKLEALGIKTMILDECQQIKNVDSSRTKEVRQLSKNPEIKVIPLSGTPWKNRGSEFFPSLNMLDPIKFFSEEAYRQRWVDYYYEGERRKEGGIRHIDAFREYTKDIIIRRERGQVLAELPLINRMKLNVQLDEIEQMSYDEATSEFVAWYNDYVMEGREDSIDGLQLLAKMSRMRHVTGLAKIPATKAYVEEFFEDNDDKKLVIFVHHKDVGQILYDDLKAQYDYPGVPDRFPVMKLTAELSGAERFEVQEKFNKTKRCILIASTLASGEGLNLQTCADCVMHERQWNPANEEQAEGRFIRIGQMSSSVNGMYVEAEGTIDEHLDIIVERKRRQFHAAMNKGEQPVWNQSDMGKQLAEMIVNKFKDSQKKNKGLTKKASIKKRA